MDDNLPLRVQTDCGALAEEPDIELYQNLIVVSAEGNLSPMAAAQCITDLLADHAYRDKQDIDLHNEDQPYAVMTDLVAMAIGSTASSFHPSHPAHERLSRLLQAFTSVARRHVPNSNLDRDLQLRDGLEAFEKLLDKRPLIPLWENLEKLHLEDNFKWLAEDGQTNWSGVEKCGSQEQRRWRNLSFFLATLTKEGVADLSYLSALFMLLPDQQLPRTGPGWSGFMAGQALAAAQWIVPEGHGAWVWQACKTTMRLADGERPPRRKWNLEYWNLWKKVFLEVAETEGDDRVHGVACTEAAKAVVVMKELESR